MRLNNINQNLLIAGVLSLPTVHAQTPQHPSINPIEQRQKEQTEQLRLQQQQVQEERARVQMPVTSVKETTVDAVTTTSGPCFKINDIVWQQAQGVISPPLYLKRKVYSAIRAHECLNQAQIMQFQKDLSNSLIEHGHITSKINLPAQNIASGTLKIDWYPGTVAKVVTDKAGAEPIGSVYMLSRGSTV